MNPQRIIKFLSSLKLAVLIMVYLAILTAWGTIVESKYDALAAKKEVYDTLWMYLGMGALSVSLAAVMVDRWPWKTRHIPFLLAHIGILVLLFGSVLTMKFGLDGSMAIPIGEKSQHVVIANQSDLVVYASFGGVGMTKYFEEEVDFYNNPPTDLNPFIVKTDSQPIRIVDFKKYALTSRQVIESKLESAGPGLRFQMTNERANVVEWLVQKNKSSVATKDLGPASINLGATPETGSGKNEIWLDASQFAESKKIKWTVFKKDQAAPVKIGYVSEGETFQTGWMGLEFRILRFMEKAEEEWSVQGKEYPTPLTSQAILVSFGDRKQWLLMNDTLRLFNERAAYLVTYMNRRIDIGFPVALKKFEKISYEGTQRAKEYRSVVDFPNRPDVEISMNEPGLENGLTFYQASFQNDDKGEPIASVLSVNYDPGRFWKYLGSLIISVGVIWLFWSRRKTKTAG